METTPESAIQGFFEALLEGFDRASASGGNVRWEGTLADKPVRIHVAGQNLHELKRPIAHWKNWKNLSAEPSLNIYAWDGSLGWLPPKPPWTMGQQRQMGEIAGLETDRFLIHYFYYDRSGFLNIYDRHSRRAIYWLPDAKMLHPWEKAAPFRVILHWWARDIGGHMAHAAVIGEKGRGILLVGRSGSGKSTAAMTCLDAQMSYLGDDYVILKRNPTPTAYSIFNSAKLHTAYLEASLSHWKRHVAGIIGPDVKSLLFIHECAPALMCENLQIACVVMPQFTGAQRAALTRRPPAEGLLALVPSTMFQLPWARPTALSLFCSVDKRAARLPAGQWFRSQNRTR